MFDTSSLQPAYVLHHRPWRDTSLIVEVWCMHSGRQTLVVKGARRAQGRQPAKRTLLQPFLPIQLSFGGRGEMGYVKQLEAAGAPFLLQGKALYCGMYMNELVLKLLPPSDPYSEIFAFYQAGISRLVDNDDVEFELRCFENSLLDGLGYHVDLTHEMHNGKSIEADKWYQFIPLQGLVACQKPCHPESPLYTETLIVGGHSLLALNQGQDMDATTRRLNKAIARASLDMLLEGKPLRSRELFRQLKGKQPS